LLNSTNQIQADADWRAVFIDSAPINFQPISSRLNLRRAKKSHQSTA
jgi:hypothetical protein